MNSWKLSAAGEEIYEAVERIAQDLVAKQAPDIDARAKFPLDGLSALRNAGALRLVSATEVGGVGEGLRAAVAVVERLGRECASTAMIVTMHYCGTAVLEQFGSKDVRQSVAENGKLNTLAFSEAGSRSHFWLPTSTAQPVPDGIKLDARKQLITAAGKADYYIWSSKPASAEGLSSIWLVPSDTAGLSLGAAFEGLGLRGNCSAPLVAADARIPKENILGEDGKGFDVMMAVVMPFFSILNAGASLGMMEGTLRRTVEHVTQATYSYDNSTLASLPQVRGHIAKMRLKIDLVRGFLLDALDAVETNRPDAMLRVLESKLAGSETSLEVHDLAMRVCGGAAFRKDVAVERFFRDSRAATVMAPVSDALYEFIGKAVCGLPVFG
jgi:alkylation response protein AidB-like acyl-CoA dehydrogenase